MIRKALLGVLLLALIAMSHASTAFVGETASWGLAPSSSSPRALSDTEPFLPEESSLPPTDTGPRVFLVIMDGVRYTETFGDPSHQYVPYLWNELRPLGTINTRFYNNGVTLSMAGHGSMLTGIWQRLSNDGSQRPPDPTVFEYLRENTGLPERKVWLITGNEKLVKLNHSTCTQHGEAYEATADSPRVNGKSPAGEETAATWSMAQRVMEEDEPSLVMVNFKEADRRAHAGDREGYLKAAEEIDRRIYQLWLKIQSTPYYQDKTTMIVVNDHGRNADDEKQGFSEHGGYSEANRHIMFLALGPAIQKDQQVDTPRELIDIAPTIAGIYGLSMPTARGKVLDELFEPALSPFALTAPAVP